MSAPDSDTMLDELDPLASTDDIAESLGVSEFSALPATMQTRAPRMLRRVSRRFRYEAQRIFTPGTYTNTARIHGGAIRLPDKPSSIVSIKVQGVLEASWESDAFPEFGITPTDFSNEEFTEMPGGLDLAVGDKVPQGPRVVAEGNWLYWDDWDFWRLNGRQVQVTYVTKVPVPEDVIDSVAAIAGRNLTIDPMSAIPQSKTITTRHYRQELANWVNSANVGFTEDDLAQARSYRYPAPPIIIANMSSVDTSPSSFFLSDSSW